MGMVRFVAQHLTRLRTLAVRRLVATCVILSMIAAPLVSAFAAHHANDVHVSGLSLLQGLSDPGSVVPDKARPSLKAADTKPQPKHTQPVADHDCHGCAAAVMPAAPSHGAREIVAVHAAGPAPFCLGRTVSIDLPPPRA